MSFSQAPSGASPQDALGLRFGRSNQLEQPQVVSPGGILGLAAETLAQLLPGEPRLPALPKIPGLKAAPSRANDPRIAAAARRLRRSAARRKGRASTILGGSIGAEPERKTLIGV